MGKLWDSAKRRLISGKSMLINGQDYILHSSVESDNHAGLSIQEVAVASLEEVFLLTRDAFKQFCLMAGTEEGRQIRLYFIAAEKKLREIKTIAPTTGDMILGLAQLYKQQETRLLQLESESKTHKTRADLLERQMQTLESNQDDTRLLAVNTRDRVRELDSPAFSNRGVAETGEGDRTW